MFRKRTTRSEKEIQQIDADRFVDNLAAVFSDCHRVLKDDGLMVFTFHQSHLSGWTAILRSLRKSGFYVETVYPVKSEMSVAVPKSQAKSPINLDTIIVCRKIRQINFLEQIPIQLLDHCAEVTRDNVKKFNSIKEKLSQNDVKGILLSSMIKTLSLVKNHETALRFLDSKENEVENLAEEIERAQYTNDLN